MPPENENQPTPITTEDSNQTETETLSMADLQKQLLDLKGQLTKDVNGVSKKLGEQIASLKNNHNQEEKQQITVEALQQQYDTRISDLQKNYDTQIEQMKVQQQEKETKAFRATIKSSVVEKISGEGFEDPQSAIKVFLLEHDLNGFIEGSDGILIYKNNPANRAEKGMTLDALVEEWKVSPVGKRFFNAQKSNNQINSLGTQPEQKKKTKIQEVVEKIQKGELEFKGGYY